MDEDYNEIIYNIINCSGEWLMLNTVTMWKAPTPKSVQLYAKQVSCFYEKSTRLKISAYHLDSIIIRLFFQNNNISLYSLGLTLAS